MGKTFNKSLVLVFIFIVSLFVFFGWYNKASASTAHPSIQFRDGNATWSDGYRPQIHAHDVDPTIKSRWESGNLTNFIRGGKYPRSLYAPDKGNRLGYDVYIGNTDNTNKQGIRIEKHGGKDFLVFDGWAAIHGYYHHGKHNQATYIGLINKKKPRERKIYKARMTSLDATKDLRWNHVPEKMCPNTGRESIMKYNSTCNMEYKNVSFRAYIPLDDIFKRGDEEWQFFIIKAVKAHSGVPSSGHINGARYVYAELVLPFEKKIEEWGNDRLGNGELMLTSGQNRTKMTMVTSKVIKRITPRGNDGSGYFIEHETYRWVRQDESSGATVWHGVRDGNSVRYASSMYWDFGGHVATLTWKRNKYDVTIRHIDASTKNETVLEQQTIKGISGKHTFQPYAKGKFVNNVGYQLVPVDNAKTVNVNRDMTIDFRYKASLPDPSRIVEVGGGGNTHGHAEGQAFWELTKDEKALTLPPNTESDFEWREVKGGVEITKYLGTRKGVVIPLQLDGKNVVSIGTNAFANKEITFVTIPFSVTNIGNYAFANNELDHIEIPDNVETIGQYAFSNNNLHNLIFPESVKTIGNYAFENNNLVNVEFHDGLEEIGVGAFRNNNLTEVDLPSSVERVGDDAFRNNDIENAYIRNEKMTFGTNVFAENQQNPRDLTIFGYDPSTAKTYANANNHTFRSFENPESEFLWREVEGGVEIVKYIGNAEIVGIPRQLDQKNVVSIGEDAFYEKKITQVFIPDTVREIKESAFAYNELTEIIIPSSVRTIGEKAFEYNQITEVVLPNSVTKLGAFAFYNNKLTRVVLPNTLTEIEDSVFEENELTRILIPTSVKTIGNNAFAGNKISELSIPLNIETIGNGAFANNELKENLIIPATVKRIGEYTFRDNSLKMVTILNRELEIGGHAFLGNQDYSYDLIIQGYSPSTAEEYANIYEHTFYDLETTTDFQWIDNGDGTATITKYIGSEKDVKIPSALGGLRVTKIGNSAFIDNGIESVTFPKTVLEIGDGAFLMNNIKEVNIPDSVQKIGLSAFAINPLEKVTIGKNLESIGDHAFTALANTLSTIIVDEENESFRSINEKGLYTKDGTKLIQGTNSGEIHPDTKIIGKSAFYSIELKNGTVMIPNGVEIIEENAFRYSGITQVMLPETVQRVESNAFADYGTKEVVILNNEVILEEKAFQYEGSLANPSNVTIYGHDPSTAKTYANERGHKFETLDKLFVYKIKQDQTLDIFDYKGTFKHVVIPSKIEGKKVTSISNSTSFGITLGAFSAKGILTVYIPDTVQTIDNFAFMGNYLTKVVIPKSVERVGNSAFSGNPLLNEVVIENHSMQFGSNVFALGNINPANIIIYGHDPSTAKDYALANGHPFKPIEELNALSNGETNAAENIISKFNPPLLKQTEVAVESPATSISKIVAMGELMSSAKKENELNKNVLSGELPVNITATNGKEGSQLYAVNNFTPTGVHYATRNTKYTLKLGSHTEVKSTPIALLTDPNAVKNQNMEYNFEYEYTNHYKQTYKCTEKKGNDCFKWVVDKTEPAWDEQHKKKFSLAETDGEFKHYTTSRLGRIKNKDVMIYKSPTDKEGTKAGENRVGYTYYIKEKAVKGNDVFYLLSDSPNRTSNVIGWVNELDLTTYTHYNMDNKSKKVMLTGNGSAYSRTWGGSKQEVTKLSKYKGKVLKVNLTETVGNNIWYRGTIDGVDGNVWVHQNNTDSIEIIQIIETPEELIKDAPTKTTLALKMDHRYGETIEKDNIAQIVNQSFLVGKNETFTERERKQTEHHEKFALATANLKPMNKLKTQSTLNMKPDTLTYSVSVPSNAHTSSNFKVLKKGLINGYYFPADVDENLKDRLKNTTEYKNFGQYAVHLQQEELIDKGIQHAGKRVFDMDFVSDYFFISEDTGFVTYYPYALELRQRLLNDETKPNHDTVLSIARQEMHHEYMKHTGQEFFNEKIIGIDSDNVSKDREKLQRYYIPVSPQSVLKPNEEYVNTIVLKDVGLNDLTWVFAQKFEFEHYLFGSGHDDAWIIEQAESRIGGFNDSDVQTIIIKNEDIDDIVDVLKERPTKKLHEFRISDRNIIKKMKDIVGGF